MSRRLIYYIVLAGEAEPWWHSLPSRITLIGRDPDNVYPFSQCGYLSSAEAQTAVPDIEADVFRNSVSDPKLEVIERAVLFARLGVPDPGDPTAPRLVKHSLVAPRGAVWI